MSEKKPVRTCTASIIRLSIEGRFESTRELNFTSALQYASVST